MLFYLMENLKTTWKRLLGKNKFLFMIRFNEMLIGLGLGIQLLVKYLTRKQQRDLYGLRDEMSPVTTSLTTQR